MSLRSSAGTARLKLNADPCPQCGGDGVVEHGELHGDCPACNKTGRFQGEARPLCANCSGTGLMGPPDGQPNLDTRPCITCRGKGLQGNPFAIYRGMMVGALVGVGYFGLFMGTFPASFVAGIMGGLGAVFIGGVVGEGVKRRKLKKARALTQLPPPRSPPRGP